ncbi:MAG TPA: aminodeoxychorismate synthase component I [Solirubrobacterales bacterium]|nr:aminodeoxychorismate synthase component I [Solirubrobacterales bacterium]
MLLARRLDCLPDPESAFVRLYGASRNAFWLDGAGGGASGRFSFMGDASGPLGAVVTYDIDAGEVRVETAAGVERRRESIFDLLGAALSPPARGESATAGVARALPKGPDVDLPFEFDCGFAGYLGYELKAECGGTTAHRSPAPDAAFVLTDRLIAFDHREGHTYLLALTAELHQILSPAEQEFDAVRLGRRGEVWIEETERRLAELQPLAEPERAAPAAEFGLRRSRERYRRDIQACKRYLIAGDSYEICLTNELAARTGADPLDLYRRLRRANPAPFSAYLRFGELAVLSSSPERFLSIDAGGGVETRPIKGTSRRGDTPGEDARLAAALREGAKFRAENVTIVDLMRNDLGRVCELGSVSVPELMRVESYETVHQLVSSVRGRLRPELGAVDAVRACFPPGSMTGAPKLRTMEIIDELEGEARGVYSGAIGWFGRGGACDLSVAIRTLVLAGGRASIGAGGAVVVDSDPEEEIAEMLLKAAAAAAALDPGAAISFAPAAAPDDSRRRPPTPTPS